MQLSEGLQFNQLFLQLLHDLTFEVRQDINKRQKPLAVLHSCMTTLTAAKKQPRLNSEADSTVVSDKESIQPDREMEASQAIVWVPNTSGAMPQESKVRRPRTCWHLQIC